jgi:phage tail-like protein
MAEYYPVPAFHFEVDLDGNKLRCSEVSGLNIEVQTIEYRDGANASYTPSKMPGIPKYGNITIKRGIVAKNNELFEWLNERKLNVIDRRALTINLLNEEHEPVLSWQVKEAFPVKIEGAALNATGNEVAIETIEIAHEGLTVVAA